MKYTIHCRYANYDFFTCQPVEVQVGYLDHSIRADVTAERLKNAVFSGLVVDENGHPVDHALIKLVKVACEDGKIYYHDMAQTITDANGNYLLGIYGYDNAETYLVFAGIPVLENENCVYKMVGCIACNS